MSFELIDDIEKKYPIKYFTRDSVFRLCIESIFDKLKDKIQELESRLKVLEDAKK